MKLRTRSSAGISLSGAEPLHRRVPTEDEEGRPLADFMMLIPGLRDWPQKRFDQALASMHAVLGNFREVVFADLNVPLNLLWVSVKTRPGVISEVASMLQTHIPEALIVSPHGRGG